MTTTAKAPQADRHADNPFSVRLKPPALRDLLDAHLKVTGQSRNDFINEAVREKLTREADGGS